MSDNNDKNHIQSIEKTENRSCVVKINSTSTAVSYTPLQNHTETSLLGKSGAPYSRIGIVELVVLSANFVPNRKGEVDTVSKSLQDRQYRQYGVCEQALEPRQIVEFIILLCCADNNNGVWIRHLVLGESSEWVVGQNVTKFGDICQNGLSRLVLHHNGNILTSFLLVKHNRLL